MASIAATMLSSMLLLLMATASATTMERDLSKLFPIELHPTNVTWIDAQPQNFSVGTRIVGGTEAVPNSFPYQAALMVPNTEGTGFCGGSIISDSWILTAAHCVDTANGTIGVVLGAHNIDQVEGTQQTITVLRSNITIHPSWNRTQLINDVALLKLSTKIPQFNSYISPIRLPSQAQMSTSFASVTATLSGWGKTSDTSQISPVLRFLTRPIMTNSQCSQFFGQLESSHMCVSGSGNVSACKGDSGGPLVIQEGDGKSTQVGIASFGYTSCEAAYPSVYTRVTSYMRWINSVTGIPIRNNASSLQPHVGFLTDAVVAAVFRTKLHLLHQ